MNWHDWTDEAFTRARELERPVVLFVEASWCRWCRQLDREVLQDERIATLLDERFVAIRVDKDRRPDLEVRYSAGGWPTLAYLDDSGEILGTDNYVEVDALLERLELVSTYYAEKRGEIQATIAGLKSESAEAENAPAKPRRRGEAPELSLDIVDHVAATIVRTADPVHGGWGERHKFPHPEAIDFALVRWSQTGRFGDARPRAPHAAPDAEGRDLGRHRRRLLSLRDRCGLECAALREDARLERAAAAGLSRGLSGARRRRLPAHGGRLPALFGRDDARSRARRLPRQSGRRSGVREQAHA